MKTTNGLINALIILSLLISPNLWAQEEESARPMYVTITKMHWNMDYEDFDMDTWKAVEKEYFDKVTNKNDMIMGSGIYLHRFTPDNRELLYVNAYASWEDIDQVNEKNGELIEAGWPDEAEREAYFKKRNAYYADFHSDEIYALMDHAKPVPRDSAQILLLRKSQFKFSEDGSQEEFMTTFKEYVENVFHKNEHIKGYYPAAHFWGSDRREFLEAFLVDSMDDLDNMFDRNGELFEEHFNTDEMKQNMSAMANKYFTGVHGDYIYTIINELRK